MQYAKLGNSGLIVSRLAFGAMTFTAGNKDMASIYKVGAQLADELVGRALNVATPPPVYPNWFIERMMDQPTARALGRTRA